MKKSFIAIFLVLLIGALLISFGGFELIDRLMGTPDTGDDKGDDGVLTATIIILSVTAVIIAGIVVFYVLEKKGVLAKLSKKQ